MSNDADSVPAGGVDEAVGTDDDKAFGYRGKYDWDDSQCNKHPTNEKATIVPSGGEIVDYSWCDGKRYVSMYVELRGLDDVADDDEDIPSGQPDETGHDDVVQGELGVSANQDFIKPWVTRAQVMETMLEKLFESPGTLERKAPDAIM